MKRLIAVLIVVAAMAVPIAVVGGARFGPTVSALRDVLLLLE